MLLNFKRLSPSNLEQMKENVHPLVSLDSNQELTQGGRLEGFSLCPARCWDQLIQPLCPQGTENTLSIGGLFCTRSSDKGRGCSQLPGGGEKGVGKGTSLVLGHSYRVQLLPPSSRTGGGQYTPSSSVLMPGFLMELEGALSHNLCIYLGCLPRKYKVN